MEVTKDYLYNREKIVLLICDFYETSQIPNTMFEIKDNLALFPVANVPLIEYILANLMDQNFKNVIVTGKKIESIVKHIKITRFFKFMNIRVLKSDGNCLGDIFRDIHRLQYEFWDLVVMYANHYTNIPLTKFIQRHRKANDTIMSVFAHKIETNDIYSHVYVTNDNVIQSYEKVQGNTLKSEEILELLKKQDSLRISTCYSGPTVAIISNQVFSLFTDNFDYENLGDFISGMLASGIYNYKFQLVTQDELEYISKRGFSFCSSLKKNYEVNSSDKEKTDRIGPECYYSREILTLLDYFKINDDVLKMSSSVFRMPQAPNFVKGNVKKLYNIENSIIGDSSSVEGNLKNCVVWDNCHVSNDFNDFIIITDGKMYNMFHLELDIVTERAEVELLPCFDKKETFFDDFTAYLMSFVESSDTNNMDLNDVFKQISLLRIVWNASKQEVIEAFAFFFVECLDVECLEDSISNACIFFTILKEFIQTMHDQELLMECLHWNLHELEMGLKTQIFFNYAFLLVEARIIDKLVVKQYNKMHKNGNF
ncbi:Translation initiation factor eIF-2B subunit epsilon [Glugoides intestinalis]